MSDFQTLLVLTGMGIAPWSARGLTQTLAPIRQASQMRRTVNGGLDDVSEAQFRKYQSTISCTDVSAPALGNIWPGMQLTVDCIAELSYPDATDAAPDRTVVAGSTRREGGFVYYRPQLMMRVVNFRLDTDEWAADRGWSMDLEEV